MYFIAYGSFNMRDIEYANQNGVAIFAAIAMVFVIMNFRSYGLISIPYLWKSSG